MEDQEKTFCNSLRNSGRAEPIKQLTDEEYIDSLKEMFDAHGLEYEFKDDYIVLKFKDTICVDSYGSTTPIYEPFVRIDVERRIDFRRTKFTHIQWSSGYAHSHVSGSDLDRWHDGMCYGSNRVHGSTFHETLITVVCFYPVFLSQESTTTRPYKRLGELALGRSIKTSASSVDLRHFLPFIKVKIKSAFGLQRLEAQIIDEEGFNQCLIDKGATVYKIGPAYYESLNATSSNIETKNLDDRFVFKGEKQEITIIPEDNIPQKTFCPITKSHILNQLTNIVNEPSFYNQTNTYY